MGAEVVEQAVPSFERQWDKGFLRLCEDNLFAREPEMVQRRFPARPLGVPRLTLGNEYSARLEGSALEISERGESIARVESIPIEVQNRIRTQGFGVSWIRVESEPRPISGVADVTVH